MKLIKNIYLLETKNELEVAGGTYTTGLILELEDGQFIRQQSDSVLMPYEPVKNPTRLKKMLQNIE